MPGDALQGKDFFWMGCKRSGAGRRLAWPGEAMLGAAMRSKARFFFGWGWKRIEAMRGAARLCIARSCEALQGKVFLINPDKSGEKENTWQK